MKITIVGSGPAAAAAVLALDSASRCQIEILDIGTRLETFRAEMITAVKDRRPEAWPSETRAQLSRQPVPETSGELPQKWMFGSDFPFRDVGQLAEVSASRGGNQKAVSGAFGGFSNAWGAQVLPFSRATLDEWPSGYDEMLPHYRAVLRHIPFAAESDDYDALFPLLAPANPLPPLAAQAERVMRRYERRRDRVRRRGITVARARLAMNAPKCISCGLCLTGCAWGLIYSAAQTLDPLISERKIRYSAGQMVLRAGEDDRGCWLDVRNVATGVVERRRTDRILIAAGGLGSTRIALNSLRPHTQTVRLEESVQLVIPFASMRPGPDPRLSSTFTLNQVNMLVEYGKPGLDLAHIHLYPYNAAFEDAMPSVVARFPRLRSSVRRRVIAGLGYLPSWSSPSVQASITQYHESALPEISLDTQHNAATASVIRQVLRRLGSVGPSLDLWPAIPATRVSGPAKSYHFGGSFKHVAQPRAGRLETDSAGRPAEWENIHLIDGSVFPSVAATTFTLTVMANAHRIASDLGKQLL